MRVAGVDGVDPVECGHVDDQPAAVLGVVAVGTAESAGEHAAVAARCLVGGADHGPDDLFGIRGAQNLGDAGAVRPQPVSRWWVIVADIVTRVPCGSLRARPGRSTALDDEVDHRRRALRHDERDGDGPGLVLEQSQRQVVESPT